MKEVFDSLIEKYKSSPLEALAGPGKMFAYEVPSGTELPYIVFFMDKSPIERDFGQQRPVAMVTIVPVSDHGKGQDEINNLMKETINLYDGAELVVSGHSVINCEAVARQQVLDDEEPNEKLWQYPITFKIIMEKGE